MSEAPKQVSVEALILEFGNRMLQMGVPARPIVAGMLGFAIGLMKNEVGIEKTRQYVADIALIVGESLQKDV